MAGEQPVDSPRPSPPRRSLLTVSAGLDRIVEGTLRVRDAAPYDYGNAPRWASAGLVFSGRPCMGGTGWVPCEDDPDSDPERRGSTVTFHPPVARTEVECSLLDSTAEDVNREAALDLLDVCQHGQVGAEFWRGDLAAAAGLDNFSLVRGSNVLGDDLSAVPAIDALGGLEEALAGLGDDACDCGGRSLIHASPILVTVWTYLGLLRVEGGLLLTALDTVVVTGPGYDGSGPSADPYADPVIDETGVTTWAFGTGLVDVRLGPVKSKGPMRDEALNSTVIRVERPWAATTDGCCAVALNVDLSART